MRRTLWTNTRSITLFFESNHGGAGAENNDDEDDDEDDHDDEDEVTRITYIGFKGDWLKAGGVPASLLYEAAANPKDHTNVVPGEKWAGGMGLGGGGGHGFQRRLI